MFPVTVTYLSVTDNACYLKNATIFPESPPSMSSMLYTIPPEVWHYESGDALPTGINPWPAVGN